MTQPAGTGPCRRRRAPFLSGLAAAILSILLLPLLYPRRATVFRAHEELVGYCCLLARGAATDPVLAGPGAFPEGLSAAGTALTGWLQSGSWVEWKTAGSVLR
ncbi:hypothetical protein JW921_09840, partial [Candidatus Fermentibacterales bacterium]|nr:hypothetical protein [Candidatus Fermentibacterales bacterium]